MNEMKYSEGLLYQLCIAYTFQPVVCSELVSGRESLKKYIKRIVIEL